MSLYETVNFRLQAIDLFAIFCRDIFRTLEKNLTFFVLSRKGKKVEIRRLEQRRQRRSFLTLISFEQKIIIQVVSTRLSAILYILYELTLSEAFIGRHFF